MSDEAKKPDENGTWQMPEPVFRSSEGHTPGSAAYDDEPTEVPDRTGEPVQSVRIKEKFRVRHQKKKKRGCLTSVTLTILILVASAALIVATVIYVIFYGGSRWF
jgi:hypothetical protein